MAIVSTTNCPYSKHLTPATLGIIAVLPSEISEAVCAERSAETGNQKLPIQQISERSKMQQRRVSEERHFTVPELARRWHYDPKTIRKWFKGKPGVLHDPHPATRRKRAYTVLRIPESIAYAEYAKRTGRAVTC